MDFIELFLPINTATDTDIMEAAGQAQVSWSK